MFFFWYRHNTRFTEPKLMLHVLTVELSLEIARPLHAVPSCGNKSRALDSFGPLGLAPSYKRVNEGYNGSETF